MGLVESENKITQLLGKLRRYYCTQDCCGPKMVSEPPELRPGDYRGKWVKFEDVEILLRQMENK